MEAPNGHTGKAYVSIIEHRSAICKALDNQYKSVSKMLWLLKQMQEHLIIYGFLY